MDLYVEPIFSNDLTDEYVWQQTGFVAVFDQYETLSLAVSAANDDEYDNVYPSMT